uniref:Uncharacterized protein n=1 Tax=Candidatus Methanogaster sp. ANME-2c ERB4 TaxID=2759911 RepID=A0A7G9YI53_9EURY|nr:hypothetical protein FJIOJMEM_00013 [Methanosarcinales archaeon ANME-2c ERB4]
MTRPGRFTLISNYPHGTVWKSSDFRNGQLDVQNAKDAKIEIGNTLRVSAPLRLSR